MCTSDFHIMNTLLEFQSTQETYWDQNKGGRENESHTESYRRVIQQNLKLTPTQKKGRVSVPRIDLSQREVNILTPGVKK